MKQKSLRKRLKFYFRESYLVVKYVFGLHILLFSLKIALELTFNASEWGVITKDLNYYLITAFSWLMVIIGFHLVFSESKPDDNNY